MTALIGKGAMKTKDLQQMINEGRVGYQVDISQDDPRYLAVNGNRVCPTCEKPVGVVAFNIAVPRLLYIVHGGTACIFEVESASEQKAREKREWPRCSAPECRSRRIIKVCVGDPRDMFWCKCPEVKVNGGELEYEGYMLSSIGIGEEFAYCLECGKIQGDFPIEDAMIQESFDA